MNKALTGGYFTDILAKVVGGPQGHREVTVPPTSTGKVPEIVNIADPADFFPCSDPPTALPPAPTDVHMAYTTYRLVGFQGQYPVYAPLQDE